MGWDEGWFRELNGLSPTQVRSLNDEVKDARYAVEGQPRFLDPQTGEPVPPLEPHKTGTAWDDLPKMEAYEGRDGHVDVTMAREKFAALPELLEASLTYVAPYRSEPEERKFRGRFATSTQEAEVLRDELRRLGRQMRIGDPG